MRCSSIIAYYPPTIICVKGITSSSQTPSVFCDEPLQLLLLFVILYVTNINSIIVVNVIYIIITMVENKVNE